VPARSAARKQDPQHGLVQRARTQRVDSTPRVEPATIGRLAETSSLRSVVKLQRKVRKKPSAVAASAHACAA